MHISTEGQLGAGYLSFVFELPVKKVIGEVQNGHVFDDKEALNDAARANFHDTLQLIVFGLILYTSLLFVTSSI